jgi:hypothetical protein
MMLFRTLAFSRPVGLSSGDVTGHPTNLDVNVLSNFVL